MTNCNLTFRGGAPTWANACVGNNGSPDYVEYSRGFSQAANLLINQVIDSEGLDFPVDDFIYPVCFNMRHSVELRLKGGIEVLGKIAEITKSKFSFDSIGSHNIRNIWSFFQVESEKIDSRYAKLNRKVAPIILDIAEIDPTGQTFRYPINTESQKHLTDIANINFCLLKQKFEELEQNLDFLYQLNTYLLDEYSKGSFTKKLSRVELFQLAQDLPEKSRWKKIDFNSIKRDLKKSYNLSSNDLSKAIKIIIDHYEMGPFIGEFPELLGVKEDEIIQFLDEWIKLHKEVKNIDKEDVGLVHNDDLKKALKQMTLDSVIVSESWSIISKTLTAEMLAGLYALFYFALYKDFSESYISTYDQMFQKSKSEFDRSSKDVKTSFNHLFNKSNALHNVLVSLFFLKHSAFAERLITRYGVKSSYPMIEKAKSRELFRKPSFCGY